MERLDVVCAIGTGVLSAILFATILSSHPPLSDGSEGAAGVASLGILHAPGYPSYILVARLFTLLIPFLAFTLRVGLFSLVCASLSVTLVNLIARRMGASRPGAALGGLCLAASAGYWYYAGFTKHDQFSGLTFLVALYLLLMWQARPNTWRLVGVAAALAFGFGSSWPLTIMLTPLVLYVLVRSWRQLTVPSLGLATLTGVVLLAGIYGFVMVRASENPLLNWGDATTPSALIQLVDRSDFSTPSGSGSSVQAPVSTPATSQSTPSSGGAGTTVPAGAGAVTAAGAIEASRAISGVQHYIQIFRRELGLAGFLLAVWGAIASLTWRRRRASIPLLIAFAVNLVGTAVTVAPATSSYDVDLVEEGFILGCFFVLACWIAIGATDLFARVRALSKRAGTGQVGSIVRGVLPPAAIAAVAVAALVPLVVVGWPVAHRSDNAFADRYAETVFSELPHRAVLFVWGSDLNFPLEYRQIVYHQRRDVVVVAVGGLRYAWYRQEIGRQLGQPLPPELGNTIQDLAHVIHSVGETRPVYIDEQATEYMQGVVGFRTVGLVSQVVPGSKEVLPAPATLERTVVAAERAADLTNPDWQVWPNTYLDQADYVSVALKAARYYYEDHNLAGMKAALLNVVHIDPGQHDAEQDLSELAHQTGGAGG